MKNKSLIEKATALDDSFDWKKILPISKEADGYLIHATTLSVILPIGQADGDARRVQCGVFLIHKASGKSEYINITARWDRDDLVRLCGFPQDFAMHDENEEVVECSTYISRYMEYVILSDLKRAVQNQFRNKSWKNTLTKEEKQSVLNAFNKAIKTLE